MFLHPLLHIQYNLLKCKMRGQRGLLLRALFAVRLLGTPSDFPNVTTKQTTWLFRELDVFVSVNGDKRDIAH